VCKSSGAQESLIGVIMRGDVAAVLYSFGPLEDLLSDANLLRRSRVRRHVDQARSALRRPVIIEKTPMMMLILLSWESARVRM